jgi:hypothetical protein
MASTPATTKLHARKPSRAVSPVEATPDLGALERFISDATVAQQSAISPDDMVREQFVTGLRVTEAKIAALDEQRSLAQRLAAALDQSFADHRAHLERAAARYRNGLLDGADQEGQAA